MSNPSNIHPSHAAAPDFHCAAEIWRKPTSAGRTVTPKAGEMVEGSVIDDMCLPILSPHRPSCNTHFRGTTSRSWLAVCRKRSLWHGHLARGLAVLRQHRSYSTDTSKSAA